MPAPAQVELIHRYGDMNGRVSYQAFIYGLLWSIEGEKIERALVTSCPPMEIVSYDNSLCLNNGILYLSIADIYGSCDLYGYEYV